MNIINLLVENLLEGKSTLRFPDCPPTNQTYRGLVEFDPEKCDRCSMCAFVCTSAAIKGKRRKDTYEWSYDPGQCTFCGRCVEVCAPQNLRMQSSRPPVYTNDGELKKSYVVIRKRPAPKPAAQPTADVTNSSSPGEPQ